MKYFLWLVMKKSSVSCTQRSTYSQILSCVLEWWTRTPNQTLHGNKDWSGSKHLKKTETWTQLMVRQWNSSGIFSQDSPHCNSATVSKSSVKNERRTRRFHKTDHLHVDVQRHLMGIWRQYKRMRIKCSTRFSICKKIWSKTMVIPRTWIREKWYSTSEDSPQGERDRIAEQMLLTLGERTHPVFRSTSPLSRGVLKCKGGGKLSIHCCADLETIKTVFRTIIWSSSCRCSTTSQGDLKTMNRNAN